MEHTVYITGYLADLNSIFSARTPNNSQVARAGCEPHSPHLKPDALYAMNQTVVKLNLLEVGGGANVLAVFSPPRSILYPEKSRHLHPRC